MKLLEHWRLLIILSLVIASIFLIHPFTKDAVQIAFVEEPASLVVREGDILSKINLQPINSIADFENIYSKINPNDTVDIEVQRETFPYSYRSFTHLFIAEEKENKTNIGISVKPTTSTNMNFNYKIAGGNKFIINKGNLEILEKRFETFKVKEYSFSEQDGKIILSTTAGEELIPLIETKGEFIAKVGNETFFTSNDIEKMCSGGTSCTLYMYQIQNRTQEETEILWKYGFDVTISNEKGEKFTELTKDLGISSCEQDRCLLDKTIDYYLDGELIGSEEIYSESKGKPYATPVVTGTELTLHDVRNSLYFTQAMLQGEMDAEVESVEKLEPTFGKGSLNMILIIAVLIPIISGVIAGVLSRKIMTGLTSMALGFFELLIVAGSLAAFNLIVTPLCFAALIIVPLLSLIYHNYSLFKIKKQGFILKKIMDINKGMNKWLLISMLVFFILTFFIQTIAAILLIYVILVYLLSKETFFRSIKVRGY